MQKETEHYFVASSFPISSELILKTDNQMVVKSNSTKRLRVVSYSKASNKYYKNKILIDENKQISQVLDFDSFDTNLWVITNNNEIRLAGRNNYQSFNKCFDVSSTLGGNVKGAPHEAKLFQFGDDFYLLSIKFNNASKKGSLILLNRWPDGKFRVRSMNDIVSRLSNGDLVTGVKNDVCAMMVPDKNGVFVTKSISNVVTLEKDMLFSLNSNTATNINHTTAQPA